MLIHEFCSRDRLFRYENSIILMFSGKRRVLGTSALNGGYSDSLEYVFNYDEKSFKGDYCELMAPDYETHLKIVSKILGLDPVRTTGLSTAASMKNVSVKELTYNSITVTAIVTGGIDVNGGRAGDPASFAETSNSFVPVEHGTINIILHIDSDLTNGALAGAMVTCTEAKAAALQELMAGSCYSRGIATGSGTDGTIIVCNPESDTRLTVSGKHSKLGEQIGLCVKSAVKEALYMQSGLCEEYQFSVLKRLKRFGIYRKDFMDEGISFYDKDPHTLVLTSLYIHLMDQLDWGLIDEKQAYGYSKIILEMVKNRKEGSGCLNFIKEKNREETLKQMVCDIEEAFIELMN